MKINVFLRLLLLATKHNKAYAKVLSEETSRYIEKQARESLEDSTNVNLNAVDMERYKRRFNLFDKERKGFITRQDLKNVLDSEFDKGLIKEDDLTDMLNEVDLNKNGQVELDEFLQLMSSMREGRVTGNRLATVMRQGELKQFDRADISVSRSGGGV